MLYLKHIYHMPPPTGLVWGHMEKLYQSVFYLLLLIQKTERRNFMYK